MATPEGAEGELKPGMNYGMRKCERYITMHDNSGKSIFGHSPALLYRERVNYALARNYALSSVPTTITGEEDLNSYLSDDGEHNVTSYTLAGKGMVIDGGVSMVVLNMGPESSSLMHRTVSIDLAIVTEGEVELELDSGDTRLL